MKTLNQSVVNDISDEEDEEYIVEQDPDYKRDNQLDQNVKKKTIKSI